MKRVLSIGQCGFDHAAIRRLIESRFDADVVSIADAVGAFDALQRNAPDLVLVNRLLDADGSEGLAIVRGIKENPQLSSVPVMMVSNYPDCQQQAVAAGAEPGFGKGDLREPETAEKLARFLS